MKALELRTEAGAQDAAPGPIPICDDQSWGQGGGLLEAAVHLSTLLPAGWHPELGARQHHPVLPARAEGRTACPRPVSIAALAQRHIELQDPLGPSRVRGEATTEPPQSGHRTPDKADENA